MGLIRRKWTARDADEWTREDALAIVLSPLSYVALMIGTAMSLLLIPAGFYILGAGIVLTILMFWVINPKLSTVSEEYEKKQKAYLEELEEIIQWEEES